MSKRGNGEGSITYQASRGRYAARFFDINGKRQVLYGKTRDQAAKLLTAALADVQNGLPVADRRITVARFLDQWLQDAARPKLKPSTYQTYQGYIEQHLKPGLGKHTLARLTPQHVQAFLNRELVTGRLQRQGAVGTRSTALSPRTVQQLHAILRSALSRAVKWQLVARNVATLVDAPRATAAEIRPLTPTEAIRFAAAAEGHPNEQLYAFLLATGLRLGEALALRWQDTEGRPLVDMEARRVTVRYTLERLRGQPWRLAEPKSASGRRTVPLAAPALAALRGQRRSVAERRLRLGNAWQDHDLVFPSGIGTPLDGTNVLHAFKRILAKADLPTTHRVHDLRHSTATYLMAAGVPVRVVMEIMGWSQVSMAMRYQHILPEVLDDAAMRLAAFFPTPKMAGG